MSEMTSKGFEQMPSLYRDNEHTIARMADMTSERLHELKDQYTAFISSEPMKHHQEQAERFLQHVVFELRYRAGEFENSIDRTSALC